MKAYIRITFLAILSLAGFAAHAQSQQAYIEAAARAQRAYNADAKHQQYHADVRAQYQRPYYAPVYYAPAPQVVYIETQPVYVERQPVFVEPQEYVRLSRYGAEAVLQVGGMTLGVVPRVR